ncbi:hypothetical protein LSH36_291g09016 [Paralvinella palmiformis]|uniref:Glycosyltransferase 61 catalytic domain-containing protein n=1 Tax=Paralvinella palmiformis TaxID=53620 RepID=A0AAD9JI64_9ANNE|nr:hypothetical protein LSH36_291g09016 [Paralvinella palmiformis]
MQIEIVRSDNDTIRSYISGYKAVDVYDEGSFNPGIIQSETSEQNSFAHRLPSGHVLRRRPNWSGIYELPDDVIWVNSEAAFFAKLSLFNDVIHNVSRRLLAGRGHRQWRPISSSKQTVIVNGTSAQYLKHLASIRTVTTIMLAWTDPDDPSPGNVSRTLTSGQSNMLIDDFYPLTGSGALCDRIRNNQPFTKHRLETVFDHHCSSNFSDAFRVTSPEPYILNAIQMNKAYYWPNGGSAWPSHFYTDLPRFVTYLHIIQDGIVNRLGEVFTDKYKIIPYNCKPAFNKKRPNGNLDSIPLVNETFSVSQYWGAGFFHKNVENFPRMAPYLEFLKRAPDVKVHVYEMGAYTRFVMATLGIGGTRLISGVFRAHLIYLPRGTSCGMAHVPETQLLSHYLRSSAPEEEDSEHNLVLIRRSRSRSFTQKAKLARHLERVAEEFGLRFYLFPDDPVPSSSEVRREFGRAVIVVAAHGAGLSNLLFCRPKTVVVEGLCNPPHTNMCYTRLAHILGLRYYAMISRAGCEGRLDVPVDEVIMAVRSLLKERQRRREI